jgi:hypothetical protein
MLRVIQITPPTTPLHAHLNNLTQDNDEKVHLKIHSILNADELTEFAKFITGQTPFPLAKLSLRIDLINLKNAQFLQILEQLNSTQISAVELIFAEAEVQQDYDAIIDRLTMDVAPKISYPLHIRKRNEQSVIPSGLMLRDFQNTIINNIQKRNKEQHGLTDERVKAQKCFIDSDDPLAKKIKLKELIKKKQLQDEHFAQYIPLEIQHVETVEQQLVQQHQEVIEIEEHLELHEIQEYSGQLLDFKAFSTPFYRNKVIEHTGNNQLTDTLYVLLKQELFANLPQAIKYLSPDAAEYLAAHLPAFVTLNKDNLAHGFILKQTKEGEFVLDYDAFLENEQSSPFTPVASDIEWEPIYDIALQEQDVRQWINDDVLFAALCPNIPYTTPQQLINLWIKRDSDGVIGFFNELKTATQEQPDLAEFLVKNYLAHLPQWEHLHKNNSFFACLKRINHYDAEKIQCLKKFLQNTGSSQHDLSKTVSAFEVFWNELHILCAEQKVPISGINSRKWATPAGGNPVVYIERMLVILKNARSLKDQFKLLKGINLDNYGAYYASRYEGFKAVADAMHLLYDVEAQAQRQFNKNFKYYRVELEQLAEPYAEAQEYLQYARFASWRGEKDPIEFWLIDCSNKLPEPLNLADLQRAGLAIPFEKKRFVPPYQFYFHRSGGNIELLLAKKPLTLSKKEYYSACFRFIGIQSTGITINTLLEEFYKFRSSFLGDPDISGELLALMFFVSHERFIENQSLDPLLTSLNNARIHMEVLNNSINLLTKLYKLDIKLNQIEGLMLFASISGMNSAEFEGLHLSKKDCIEKLLYQLEKNKFATFKLFNFRVTNCNRKWPFLYALDTAEYLAKDPIIAANYHDDLLLFSGLINSIEKEVYYHARVAGTSKERPDVRQMIMGNMQRVQHYLHEAASQIQPNNLHYAIQVLLNGKTIFTFENFLAACAQIEKLPAFDSKNVDAILRHYKFTLSAELPEIFTKDNADLKSIMISLIIQLENTKNKVPPKATEEAEQNLDENAETFTKIYAALATKSIAELQVKLHEAWAESGTLLSVVGKIYLNKILKTAKEQALNSAFAIPEAQGLLKIIAARIVKLADFQDYSDFAKVNRISAEAETIARLFKKMLINPYVVTHEHEFITLFSKVDFSKFDYETLYSILNLLTAMPQRNYLSLLHTIFANADFIGKKERVVALLNLLTALNNSCFPSEYLDAFSKLMIANPDAKEVNLLIAQMVAVFDKDNKDSVLSLLMTHSELTYPQFTQILSFSAGIEKNRDKLSALLIHLIQTQKLPPLLSLLNGFVASEANKQKYLLEILSRGHGLNRANNKTAIDYTRLATLLKGLSAEELELLHAFYETTPVSAECLLNALNNPNRPTDFQSFLFEFEKAPFGERDLQKQFSLTEVERVINQSKDLLNDSVYTYHYRQQLMESFLFVNSIGEQLPVYYNKPAKDLTNAEIKSFFADLKAKKIAGLTPFQNRLLALGLMREVMHRSSGEFPYSTQMIALIDGMMHQGDFISNIDTGQGKSLIDSMKAALLWLDSDRVDITTSSLGDARRDIANYGSFFKLLGIPYSAKPISSSSSGEDFQKDGVNISTFAQLSLFFAKAKVTGKELETPDTVVSLVANESDYAILDDRVIYRFATADGSGVSYGQEWIYYAINEFVARPEYINNGKTNAGDDIADLKTYLKNKAQELKKSGKIVNKFTDAQYLAWLESALMVNYVLKENDDYVIPDEFEKKTINGAEFRSKVVKVLLKDDKVSPDSTFGNGIQQLLYAHLNKKCGCTDFVIEPQNKTIISTNNKNLIDYYRAHKGFIWGSSGTVGSQAEIQEQYRKYGFEFSKTEPHQKNRVKFTKPIIAQDEQAQFQQLIAQLTAGTLNESTAPNMVFCKDINTAIRLFKELERLNTKNYPLQLYTGLGKEEEYINNARKPGMITITTSALARNTDIHYDKILRVWHTFIDSIRDSEQKSGRTGRQGSAGEVNFILNAQELGAKTIEQIQAELDNYAAIERSVTEDLYNVLGHLLSQVDAQPDEQFVQGKTAFLRASWSEFSAKTETHFRERCRETDYDRETFMQKTLVSFNQMMKSAAKTSIEDVNLDMMKKTTARTSSPKEKYKPYSKRVTPADCAPPVALAYHLLSYAEEEKEPEVIKNEIKNQLTQLFMQINKNNFTTKNSNYLHYLAANPSTQAVIVAAHKEFLTQYLHKHSQKLNFVQRWLGYEGKLNQIANNQNYLLIFHAFTHVSNQPVVTHEVIKQAINTLLDEYLETSWFINRGRKKWAVDLKTTISQTTDIDALLHCLSQSQLEIAKQDIDVNKHSILKPLHFFRHSRYQTTLNRALNLAMSLSGKTELDKLTNELNPLIAAVTDQTPMTDVTVDKLRLKAAAKHADKNNAPVLLEALENILTIRNRQSPSGMSGRTSFFDSIPKEQVLQDETNNPESGLKNN